MHHLHRDPHQTVRLCAEGVYVSSIWMLEARSELRFSQESLDHLYVGPVLCMQNFYHRFAREGQLLGPVDYSKASFSELIANDEISKCAVNKWIWRSGDAVENGFIEEAARLFISIDQRSDFSANG